MTSQVSLPSINSSLAATPGPDLTQSNQAIAALQHPPLGIRPASQPSLRLDGRVPIVFSAGYDFQLEDTVSSVHPFHFRKRSDAYNLIRSALSIRDEEIFEPPPATYEELRRVHDTSYLERLSDPHLVSQVMSLPDIRRLAPNEIRSRVLSPILLATGGTILGMNLALHHGWAVNLSGGFHHASRDRAEGFCFIADTPVAFKCLKSRQPDAKVFFCDLDAHFMNGPCLELAKEPGAVLFDIHNRDLAYPNDPHARSLAHYSYPVPGAMTDDEYLGLLRRTLPPALDRHAPHLVIYHAGCDVYRGDKLGRMSLSIEAVVERDSFVFRTAFERGIPILMVLAGGYSSESASIISRSVVTMAKRYLGA